MSFRPQDGLSCGMRPPPEPSAPALIVDVGAIDAAHLSTVDALARLKLVARQLGRPLLLRHASPELVELIAFVGLAETLPCEGATPRGAAAGRTGGTGSSCPGRT